MTTSFVLSGGGNRGPLEVGALQSLLEHGIRPDFMVGTSAGSLNASFLAAYGPELSSIPRLAAAWRSANAKTVYPGNALTAAWRVLRGADSLFPSDGVRRLIAENMPPGITTFGQLKCPCYVTAIELHHIRITAFGNLAFNDFAQVDEMIAAGKAATDAYLANPQPRAVAPRGAPAAPGRAVPGAREYVPPGARSGK